MIVISGRSLCENCFEETSEERCPSCGFARKDHVPDPGVLPCGSILQGRYMVGRVIGKGGFGVTYLAYDTKLERKIAVKEYYPYDISTRHTGSTQVIVTQSEKNQTFKTGAEKFYDEARMVAKFNNTPGIVGVYDFFYENDTVYYSMEYLQGESLKDRIMKSGTISPEQAVFIAKSIASALAAAHSHKVLHRDVSPDNIIVCSDGNIKLIDFGAARQVVAEGTQNMSVILKPGFAPLEQYQKKGRQGPWTDIYSLGTTLYYVLTGMVPDDPMSRIEDGGDFERGLSHIPENIRSIIRKMTELDIEKRYQDAGELKRDLDAVSPGDAAVMGSFQTVMSQPSGSQAAMSPTVPLHTEAQSPQEMSPTVPLHTEAQSPQEMSPTVPLHTEMQSPQELSPTVPLHTEMQSPQEMSPTVPLHTEVQSPQELSPTVPLHTEAQSPQELSPTVPLHTEAQSPQELSPTVPLHTEAQSPQELSPTVPLYPEMQSPQEMSPTVALNTEVPHYEEDKAPDKKKSGRIIAVSAAAVIALIILAAAVLLNNKDGEDVAVGKSVFAKVTDTINIGGTEYKKNMTGTLDLTGKGLKNEDIVGLQYMTELDEIILSDNDLTDLSVLSGLKNLKKLTFHNNNVSDLSFAKGLTKLTVFGAENNGISDISVLSGMKNLEEVWVQYNKISDISALGSCKKLQYVGIHDNLIKDLTPLAACESIRVIYAENNKLDGNLDALKGLTVLENIYVTGNGYVPGDKLQKFLENYIYSDDDSFVLYY